MVVYSCVPIFTSEVASALSAFKKAHPNDTRTEDPLIQPISGWDIGTFLADVIHGGELIVFSGGSLSLLYSRILFLPGQSIVAGQLRP